MIVFFVPKRMFEHRFLLTHLVFLYVNNFDSTSDESQEHSTDSLHIINLWYMLTILVLFNTQEGAPTLRILQLSDIHLDENYAVGSNTDCGEPLCCRGSNGLPSTAADGAGYWGDYRNCDIPPRMFDSLLSHLKSEKVNWKYFFDQMEYYIRSSLT